MPGLAPRMSRPASPPAWAVPRAEKFRSAEEAWFWTMAALAARREGARFVAGLGRAVRPCEPDDVIRCLDALYRARKIGLAHARVLRVWGDRQVAPSRALMAERAEWVLWREACERLEWKLRVQGIVG